MAAVVPTRVASVQPLKRSRETRISNPDDRVVVAPHQHVRDQCELEALADRGEAVEEIFAVGIDDEEETLVTPSSGEVVDAVVERTQGPSHGSEARWPRSWPRASGPFLYASVSKLMHSRLDETGVGHRFCGCVLTTVRVDGTRRACVCVAPG